MDIDAARAGAILVCPVKLAGAGVYLGDMHALQGDGEIAGHTCDVAGTVTLQVEVLKGLGNDGPVLFPVEEDLPFLARPLSDTERERALALARRHGVDAAGGVVSRLGRRHGPRPQLGHRQRAREGRGAARLSVPEVMNRATIAGAIEIGRAPGRRAGHVPGARRPARGLRPARLRRRAVRRAVSALMPGAPGLS